MGDFRVNQKYMASSTYKMILKLRKLTNTIAIVHGRFINSNIYKQ
jgi:hypothetical protein